jgi:hypothetical protein
MAQSWDSDFAARSTMLEPLRAAAALLRGRHWPGCAELNRVLEARDATVLTGGGKPLRFVAHEPRRGAFEDRYEPRIFLRGEVQVRSCNWHDLLNALVWLTFPAAKAALNARQYAELVRQEAGGAPNRGPVQDALTLFDEGGVIVAVGDAGLGALLGSFEWKELFWRRRDEAASRMRFYLFGHALCEKALQPFSGITGRGVMIEVAAASFFALPLAAQLAALDSRVAAHIADPLRFTATRELTPVPILGVPGWWSGNESETYYDDAGYFRPARAGSRR